MTETSEVFEGAIGIDLGTTYSCVSVFLHDRVDVIPNDQGNRTTPSVVAYGGAQVVVGDPAKALVAKNPKSVIYDAKRMIGRKFADKEVKEDATVWPFTLAESPEGDGLPVVKVEHQGSELVLKPEQVSATVLSYLKGCAEKHLGKKVAKAVITVPAYFNDSQRERTKAAGQIAGLDVLRIINEPTAAALAYGIDSHASDELILKNVVVFDFGGGTFDVSIVTIEGTCFGVRSTAGDTHLGGQDIDALLCKYFVDDIKKKNKIDLSESPKALAKLRRVAETAKKALSHATQYDIEIDGLLNGDDWSMQLTRAKLEELCQVIFKKCIDTVQKAVADAGLMSEEIDEVVMVGGSSRIPKINQLVSAFFGGKQLNNRVSPDEAIAVGAAIQASILSTSQEQQSEQTEGVILMDVIPLSLGIDVDDGSFEALIPRNSTIPNKKTKEFSTFKKNQTRVIVEVFEGERPLTKHNRKLGEFALEGISKAPAGEPSIMVTFSVDANGLLTVSATEEKEDKKGKKQKSNSLVVKNEDRLSTDDIEKMVADAAAMREKDKQAMEIRNIIQPPLSALQDVVADFEEIFVDGVQAAKTPEGDDYPVPKKSGKLYHSALEAIKWLENKQTAAAGTAGSQGEEGSGNLSTASIVIRAEKMMKLVSKLKKKLRKIKKKLKITAEDEDGDDEGANSSDDEGDDPGSDSDAPAKKRQRSE